jgi:hypothetical protein
MAAAAVTTSPHTMQRRNIDTRPDRSAIDTSGNEPRDATRKMARPRPIVVPERPTIA